jgi:hypothetical protein
MNIQQLRIVTFDVGLGYEANYKSMLKASNGEKHEEEFTKKDSNFYNNLEVSVANKLAKESDIICLQKIKNLNRSFISTLQELGFVIHIGSKEGSATDQFIDCAIAYKKDLVEKISDISIKKIKDSVPLKESEVGCGKEMVGLIATLKENHCKIAFASIHNQVFQLYPDDCKEISYSKLDKRAKERSLDYIKKVAKKLAHCSVDCRVIAGNMNNNRGKNNYIKPFDLLEKRRGYKILEPSNDTSINEFDNHYSNNIKYDLKVIDYIFFSDCIRVSKKLINFISSFFFDKNYFIFEIENAEVLNGFDFQPICNCSDHKPVRAILEIKAQTQLSTIHKIWANFIRIFSRSNQKMNGSK